MPKLADDDHNKDLLGSDEEVDEQVDWEEELEAQYGDKSQAMRSLKKKVSGPGFSKQKEIMEQSGFYQKKKGNNRQIVDRTKLSR